MVAALVMVFAGIFAVDRAASALFGKGLFSWPPMSVVLDGWVASGERQAALDATQKFAEGLAPEGTTLVGEVQFVACSEGEHDWKRRDDFRLDCSAFTTTFRSWSGDFDSIRAQATAPLAQCGVPAGGPSDLRPIPGYPTPGDVYDCGSGTTVGIVFGSSVGLESSESVVAQAENGGSSRHVSGPSPAELVQALAHQDWFVVYEVGREFFRD